MTVAYIDMYIMRIDPHLERHINVMD